MKGTTFQKNNPRNSLTAMPLTQPTMSNDCYVVSIVTVQEGNKRVLESVTLNLEEALNLRDSLIKSFPLNIPGV